MKQEKYYYVYILASKRNGTLYIGVSNNVLNRKLDSENEMLPLFELLNIRSTENKTITESIKNNTAHFNELNNLMSSYIHMTMNRLFKSKQRIHEMVVYDILFRYYKSELAKQKYAKK